MFGRNKGKRALLAILALVAVAIVAGLVWMTVSPDTAFGMDPGGYVDSFMSQNGLAQSDSNTMLEQNGFQTYQGGNVLPGFEDIGETMTYLILGFVPVLFVIKFAGRAILNVTHSGQGKMDIPNFFKTAKERGQGERGGARDDSAWYIDMGKDFLRFFGIAVAVWLVFAGIIAVINLVMGYAPNADANSDTIIGQLGG